MIHLTITHHVCLASDRLVVVPVLGAIEGAQLGFSLGNQYPKNNVDTPLWYAMLQGGYYG